ncbi:MAG: polyphosphate kinase 2 family protein [Chloroflexota bacterium]|nr:polyphosphate kinase 2 family protein [Chloroflexota bacterium]
MAKLDIGQYRVRPGEPFELASIDPDAAKALKDGRGEFEAARDADLADLRDLHERLFAEGEQALLIVMLAIDTGGKDSTIDRIFSGLNPQGCVVSGFRAPTEEELARAFLWRIHQRVPRKGQIGIFNRSHYEDVTVPRVRGWIDEAVWERRYAHILDFESLLVESGTAIVKFHLRISKDEQAERLQDRLDDPSKHWKFDPNDLADRKRWDDYQRAFEEAIAATSTDDAPWYVVPANSKWYRDAIVARAVVERMRRLDPQYPPPVEGIERYSVE